MTLKGVSKSTSSLQEAVPLYPEETDVLNDAKNQDKDLEKLLDSSLSFVNLKFSNRSFKDMLPNLKVYYPVRDGIAYQVFYYDKVNKCICDQACVNSLRDFFDTIGSQSLSDLEQKFKEIKRRVPPYLYNPENVVFIVSHVINCISGEVTLLQDLLGFTLWDVYSTENQCYILDKRQKEAEDVEKIAERLKVLNKQKHEG